MISDIRGPQVKFLIGTQVRSLMCWDHGRFPTAAPATAALCGLQRREGWPSDPFQKTFTDL